MSDPPRLLESASPYERDLLRSWNELEPPPSGRTRALAIVAGVGGASSIGKLATDGLAQGAATSVSPKAVASAGLLVKWLALGGLVAASAAAVGVATMRPTHRSSVLSASASTAAARSAESNSDVSEPVSAVAPLSPPSASDAPAPSTPEHHTRIRRGVSPSAPAASALSEEVILLDEGRSALARNDAARALRIETDYESRFPAGVLAQEASVLRIEALLARGDVAAAEAGANRFLAQHPASPHAARVRALLAKAHQGSP